MKLSMKVSLKSNDKVWRKMARNLSKGGDKTSSVGWWNSMHPTGVPTAQVAAWNEDGHYNGIGSIAPGAWTPSRPFMSKGFMPEAVKALPEFFPLVNRVAMGFMSWKQLHEQIGMKMKPLLQDIIEAWSSPANSPTTVKIKGFNDPLIHSGHMLDTVKYKVGRK